MATHHIKASMSFGRGLVTPPREEGRSAAVRFFTMLDRILGGVMVCLGVAALADTVYELLGGRHTR